MAKRTPISTKTKLLVHPEEAKEKIIERIALGKELQNQVINSQAVLDEAQKKYFNWTKYNSQLLESLFSDSTISEEYSRGPGIYIIRKRTLPEEVHSFQEDISVKIQRLESVIERINLFPYIDNPMDAPKNHLVPRGNKVFIIHGHDETRLMELEKLIRDDFGLTPIILKDQPHGGSTTIIEKFELYAPECSYAIALFTPDDQVENGGKKYLQARPNVIYELGWFSAKLTRSRVLLILKQGTDIFSDFEGILQLRFNETVAETYRELHRELKNAKLVTS